MDKRLKGLMLIIIYAFSYSAIIILCLNADTEGLNMPLVGIFAGVYIFMDIVMFSKVLSDIFDGRYATDRGEEE